jgi:hypothetical protein
MKILSAGKLPNKINRNFRGTCSNCQCKVEVTEMELQQLKIASGYNDDRIICPTLNCKHNIIVGIHITRHPITPPVNDTPYEDHETLTFLWPTQYSGNRFEYRMLNNEWQIYGFALKHACICESEDIAKLITDCLNKQIPST